jgi:hypothetical protein
LFERDGVRFVQPAQVGRKIGNCRLDEHPAAGLVHLAQPSEGSRVGAGRRRGKEWFEVVVGRDVMRRGELCGAREQRLFSRVPANRRQRRELSERSRERR